MLGTIYIGLSGMTAYSKGLDVISNNVANLNTPGFKLTDPSYSSSGTPAGGAGVSVDTGRASFRQGELRDTGNPLDAGVEGNGFFTLGRDGQQLFTRAGQFEFNKDGDLVDRATGAAVIVSRAAGGQSTFNLDDFRVFDPKATAEVRLQGTLSRTGTATYDLTGIPVIDASGARQVLAAKLIRSATDATVWTVEVSDAASHAIGSGELHFGADGTPVADFNKVTATVKPADLPEFDVVLNFGEAGKFSGVSSLSSAAASQVSVFRQDGVERGVLASTTFDDRGQLTLTYSNGEKKTPATLMLAQFDSSEQLQALGAGLYVAKAGTNVSLAPAQSQGRGTVTASKVEMSNVDLTQQFTDLIIIQRGYQASSQMTSVANEMIQQLLNMGDKR
ncbi:MAG: flagellar basal-body rod protein FlgF [Gammaproteobacteria bacterium]